MPPQSLTQPNNMNRIEKLMKTERKVLSIYFTAGYPQLDDTIEILKELERSGVDMVEIGLPFSDPLADGPTIQKSSEKALANGMSTELLFSQLNEVRRHISIPLLLMGYFNPILQYGPEAFFSKCRDVGIDGLIIPDLPLSEYNRSYRHLFEQHGLLNIFLITPQTSGARILEIDTASNGFIYMVSSASTTGSNTAAGPEQGAYFDRISRMALENPQIVGFGIRDAESFSHATTYASGAIIGSAFIEMLKERGIPGISQFIRSIRPL